MRVRSGVVAFALTCTVMLTAYETESTSAQALPVQPPDAEFSAATAGTLAPGQFRVTTGLDKEPQYVQGPVACDAGEDSFTIAIGDPDAGGVEIGLSPDESALQYVDLGYRNGVSLVLLNNGETDGETGQALPVVHKTANTYFVSGYAIGMTASHRDTSRYFEITVACP